MKEFAARDCNARCPLQLSFPGAEDKVYSNPAGAGFPAPAGKLLWATWSVETPRGEETPVSKQPGPRAGHKSEHKDHYAACIMYNCRGFITTKKWVHPVYLYEVEAEAIQERIWGESGPRAAASSLEAVPAWTPFVCSARVSSPKDLFRIRLHGMKKLLQQMSRQSITSACCPRDR